MAMHTVSKGRSVLDLFSYTGAFAVHAALSGAKSVLSVDIKEDWLRLGRENASLNGVADRIEFARADSFDFLKKINSEGRMFDMIILDPPSFIKAKHSIVTASKGYKDLNLAAMKCLTDGGVLATFSCSHNMPNEIFSGILKEAATEAGKTFSILKRCRQAEDHPVVREIPETEYLKGYFLKVGSRKSEVGGKE
jgi:23S rRNA (cytosine1962-C5)-methyltransferase